MASITRFPNCRQVGTHRRCSRTRDEGGQGAGHGFGEIDASQFDEALWNAMESR